MSNLGLLKKVAIFKDLTDEELNTIDGMLVERYYKKGCLILKQGDAADAMFMVKEGNLRITKLTMDGKEKIAGLLKESDFFGEICILIGKERCINARAVTDCRLAALSRSDTISILEKMPKVAFSFINTLCSRLVEAEHHMDGLLFKSIEERITDQLYELSKGHGVYLNDGVLVNIKLTHQFLADMIGISRESVTRGIKELKREGVIKYMKNRHYVLDASPFRSI